MSIVARGTLKADAAGLVAGIASQANSLKVGAGADDIPTVVVEFDTGYNTSCYLHFWPECRIKICIL